MVLYLDFDGVLHPLGTEAIDENGQLLPNPVLFCWLPILEKALAPFPDVKIIVSSDWRRICTDEKLIELLGNLGSRFAGVMEACGGDTMLALEANASLARLDRELTLLDPAVRQGLPTDTDYPLLELFSGLSGRFTGLRPPAQGRAAGILADALLRGLSQWLAFDDHASVHDAAVGDPRFIACNPMRGISDESVIAQLQAALEADQEAHLDLSQRE